jgi:hypothetical protein
MLEQRQLCLEWSEQSNLPDIAQRRTRCEAWCTNLPCWCGKGCPRWGKSLASRDFKMKSIVTPLKLYRVTFINLHGKAHMHLFGCVEKWWVKIKLYWHTSARSFPCNDIHQMYSIMNRTTSQTLIDKQSILHWLIMIT